MASERRRNKRVAADAPASIALSAGKPARGTVANLSEDGMFVKAEISPGLHRPVHLQFILRPDHVVCTAAGKVAWQAPHGIGVVFDETTDSYRAFVEELITADKSIQPGPKRAVLERILGDIDVAID